MHSKKRLDKAIDLAIRQISTSGPPRLKEALGYALFPGGGRVRPRFSLAVFDAVEGTNKDMACASAAALEMIHSASLVHDDLPCFDDALVRRSKPALHRVYGEDMAVLVGDALIIGAMETLARGAQTAPARLPALLLALTRATGASEGLVAGQAMEGDAENPLEKIHLAKTAALFEAAAVMGALSAGADPEPWRPVGRRIGRAYQVADDLLDGYGTAEEAGKNVGQDERHQRPSATDVYPLPAAVDALDRHIRVSIDSVPTCPGQKDIVTLLGEIGQRLCPPALREKMLKATDETVDAHTEPPEELVAL